MITKPNIGRYLLFKRTKPPIYLQHSETECGIACLAMILAYHGTHIAMDILREKCGTSRDGCKASTLMKVAESYGYDTKAYSIDIADLYALSQPVVAYWNFSHYIVINRIKNNRIYINDPAQGSITLAMDEFAKGFTGIIILVNPTRNALKIRKETKTFSHLLKYISGHYKELFFIIACSLIISSSPLIHSGLSTLLINHCMNNNNIDLIPYIASVATISMSMLIIATCFQKTITFRLCTKTGMQKSAEIVEHIFHLPLMFFSIRQKSAVIAILSRVELMINQLLSNSANLIFESLMVVICLGVMMQIDIYLLLVSITACTVTLFPSYILIRCKFNHDKTWLNALAAWYMHNLSCIKNIEMIKICGLESRITQKWRNLFCKKLNVQDKTTLLTILMDIITKYSSLLSMLFILFMGGQRIHLGVLSIGHIMGFYSLYVFLSNHLMQIVQAFVQSQDAYASHLRCFDLLQNDQDVRFNHVHLSPRKKQSGRGELSAQYTLTCKDLTFYYNKMAKPVLTEINLKIDPGSHVAFVGQTGSGKSTLAKLLCALYRAEYGQVNINHSSILDLSAKELSQYFSFVSQDVSLFSGTLYENMTLWREDIPIHKINQAIHIACLSDLVAIRGLHCRVEEGGSNFSMGEKQRIDIARALIQDTPIMIMDEATASLDVHTETRLIMNLRQTSKTIIYVAHRLTTIRHCDQIYVIDNGMIVEQGTHDTLITQQGTYQHLLDYEYRYNNNE